MTMDCEITRLPEELLSVVISHTTPRDACCAAAVCTTFHTTAESDAVWSRFLPRDLPLFSDGELSPTPMSKKALFLRLSDRPVLLLDKLMSMWLDRETGTKCYMLSARALHLVGGDAPEFLRWIPLTDSRFSEGAELGFSWFEIHGKIPSMMLSQKSSYDAYLVFKIPDEFCCYRYSFDEATICIGGCKSTREVCLNWFWCGRRLRRPCPTIARGTILPSRRDDGWMELELGEFYNKGGENDEVCISQTCAERGWERGLIVQGIEIRCKM